MKITLWRVKGCKQPPKPVEINPGFNLSKKEPPKDESFQDIIKKILD